MGDGEEELQHLEARQAYIRKLKLDKLFARAIDLAMQEEEAGADKGFNPIAFVGRELIKAAAAEEEEVEEEEGVPLPEVSMTPLTAEVM